MYLCWTVLLALKLLFTANAAPDYHTDLYEGSRCIMEDNRGDGKCIKIPECPTRLQEVHEGKRFANSPGHCGFDGFIEIVCCPLSEVQAKAMPEMRPQRTTTSRGPLMRSTTGLPFTRPPIVPTPVWTISPPITTTGSFEDDIGSKLGLRPADVACQEYERKITGSSGHEVNPNIFEGINATKGEFPHVVALGYRRDKENPELIKYSCGGTLITVQHVLTAAHCVSNINNYVPTEVKIGAIHLNDNSNNVQNIKVSEIKAHPSYKRSLNYFDIAILKLERPAELTQYVQPICLQTKRLPNLDMLVNMSLVVTGWGATSFEDEGSETLQKTPSLQLIERLECAKFYKEFSKLPRGIDDSMICVLDKNVTRRSDACQGDSGGPLLYGNKVSSTVLGVTSFGQSCGSAIPAIYTNVIFYLDWIEDMVWPNRKRALTRT